MEKLKAQIDNDNLCFSIDYVELSDESKEIKAIVDRRIDKIITMSQALTEMANVREQCIAEITSRKVHDFISEYKIESRLVFEKV